MERLLNGANQAPQSIPPRMSPAAPALVQAVGALGDLVCISTSTQLLFVMQGITPFFESKARPCKFATLLVPFANGYDVTGSNISDIKR